MCGSYQLQFGIFQGLHQAARDPCLAKNYGARACQTSDPGQLGPRCQGGNSLQVSKDGIASALSQDSLRKYIEWITISSTVPVAQKTSQLYGLYLRTSVWEVSRALAKDPTLTGSMEHLGTFTLLRCLPPSSKQRGICGRKVKLCKWRNLQDALRWLC